MTTPIPDLSRVGTPPTVQRKPRLSEAERLKQEMDRYRNLISRRKKDVLNYQRQIKNLGSSAAQLKIRAQLEARIKSVQADIGKLQEKFEKSENKYFESTGQYEKLLKGTERNAFMALNAMFKQYDLGTLAGKIFDYVKQGYSADTISILLQDTKEYKERFAGNEARKKAGLPVLSPAEYIATEAAYRQIMESAGLPKGFYDTHKDFNDFIGKNLSPSEIQNRVDLAVQATTLANDQYRKALKQMGFSEGELVAYFLDEKKALPILTKTAATARIGAEALRQGLTFNQNYAAQLATQGITAEQAAQGYSSIAEELGTLTTLGSIYGERWNQRESERATFEGAAGAVAKKKRLASQERGQFGGAAGGARGGLAQRGGQR